MKEKLHIIPHQHKITLDDRIKRQGYQPALLWFTGLSGSGKSTLANAVEDYLFQRNIRTYLLDGDNVRAGLNADLDFSEQSRKENIRRIGEVAKLFVDSGTIALTAFISPFIEDRKMAAELVGEENFIEIFVDCPLEVCEQRDVKGLYQKARKGEIKNFTGIDSPFEVPPSPDVKVNTDSMTVEECAQMIIDVIMPKIESR